MSNPSRLLPGIFGLFLGIIPAQAISIPNASFEVDQFSVSPGSASANGGITGWTHSGSVGLNPASGNPFADNGSVPDGLNVAYLQSQASSPATLSTTITGLTTGQVYTLHFRANMRASTIAPVASYSINGGAAVSFSASPAVGAWNAYYPVSATFTASDPEAALVLTNAAAADSALLVDDFSISGLTESAGQISPAAVATEKPSVAMRWMIATQGLYPSTGADSDDPYLGEVRCFAQDIDLGSGWLPCDGRSLPINQNTALYSLLGVTYGGNNITTFNVPDMRGRTPIGAGQGPGLTNRSIGQSGGQSFVLGEANLPPHSHSIGNAFTGIAGSGTAVGNMPPYMVFWPWLTNTSTATEAGTVRWYAGTINLPGLPCNGASLDTTAYGTLFSRIGYSFGGSDSNFQVPDLRGRMAIGCGEGPGLTARTLGAKGGSETWALGIPDLPAHVHGYLNGSTGSTGGPSASGSTMAPYLVLNPAVAINGLSNRSNMIPAVGELRFFAVAPEQFAADRENYGFSHWMSCDGAVGQAWEFDSFGDTVGDLWGGDLDQGSVALPDLRGRITVCSGQGSGLPNRTLTDLFGSESTLLTAANLPAHRHEIDLSTRTLLSQRFSPDAGAPATFAATVTGLGGVPTGEVSFHDGSTLIGTAVLDSTGVAMLTPGTLGAGVHSIRASYEGDANFSPSLSSAFLFTGTGWSAAAWTGDPDSGISAATQWAYHFGSNNPVSVGGKAVTGIGGPNPADAGKFAVSGMALNYSGDTNELTDPGGDGSAEIARTFVYNGNPGTITLEGLTPGTAYVATILSVGFEGPGARKATFTSSGQSLQVDQDMYGNNRGIRLDYAFTADATTRAISVMPEFPGQTWHLYALAEKSLLRDFSVFNGNSTAPADQRTHNTGTVSFADTFPGTTSDTKTFTLKNTGTVYLSGLGLSKSGANPGDFNLGALGKTDLAPGDTTTFTVSFSPGADGTRGAVVNLDGAGSPFAINVSGNAPFITVTSLTDAALRAAVNSADAASGAVSIKFSVAGGGTIPLTSQLPILRNPHGIRIDGANEGQGAIVIDGGSTGSTTGQRIFYVGVTSDTPGGSAVTPDTQFRIANLTLRNGNARGATGGGGGAGLGGAIFLNAGELALANVNFLNNRATGGNGGNGSAGQSGGDGGSAAGGGSGAAGTGGTVGGDAQIEDDGPGFPGGSGGSGSGATGSGGGRGGDGGNGGEGGTSFGKGGDGGNGGTGGTGGPGGFGGGGADGGRGGEGGLGGTGIGLGSPGAPTFDAGAGGDGGDGSAAGNGGFGGGGGGAGAGGKGGASGGNSGGKPGGTGGDGGDAGTPGSGGFGAGNGAAGGLGSPGIFSPDYDVPGAGGNGGLGGPGGGGAGLGAAVFVRQGATLTITDGTVSGGAANGGSGGTNGVTTAGNGQGIGAAFFLAGSTTYEVSGNTTITLADTLGGGVNPQISGGFTKSGTGTLVLAGANNYTGGTTINGGTLGIGHDTALGNGPITLNGGGLRATGSSRTLSNPMTANGSFALGRATNLNGTLALNNDMTILSTNPDSPAGGSVSTLGGVISGAHSITFAEGVNPVGTIALGSQNTYTGDTILAGGRVALTGGANVLPDNTRLIFSNSSAVLQLNAASETVKALYFGNSQAVAGTWGASGSGATHIDSVHFSGTGLLAVTTGPTFATWAADKGLSGANAAFDADPNKNGIPNGIEFVLGGEPALPGMPALPTAQLQGGDLIFTFLRTDASAPLNPVVEFNTQLSGAWTTAIQGSNASIQVSNGAPSDTVTVTIPRNGSSRIFARLRVTP